ncbi:hypothetical protein EV424DRAFT_681183 [Suillus variegatus]|nr:hypothetical protein EV424DRAFT_681183 [Suillus variegatus]
MTTRSACVILPSTSLLGPVVLPACKNSNLGYLLHVRISSCHDHSSITIIAVSCNPSSCRILQTNGICHSYGGETSAYKPFLRLVNFLASLVRAQSLFVTSNLVIP